MADNGVRTGHRERLRQRFLVDPISLTDAELIELLLTCAIPRQDVAPQAQALLQRFRGLRDVFAASPAELRSVPGIGEQSALLLGVIARLMEAAEGNDNQVAAQQPVQQPTLFALGSPPQQVSTPAEEVPPQSDTPVMEDAEASVLGLTEATNEEPDQVPPAPAAMRAFANDEIASSLQFLPHAATHRDLASFRTYLCEHLPYNSISTRQRRASHILNRFFPDGQLATPLAYFATHCSAADDLKPAIFYHVLRSEPMAAKLAEQLVWPALPVGKMEREAIREFLLRLMPDLSASSQTNALRSLFNTYALLSVGTVEATLLRFQVHPGTEEAFLYLLTRTRFRLMLVGERGMLVRA